MKRGRIYDFGKRANYFRGNTPARRARMRKLQKKILAKRFNRRMWNYFNVLERTKK